MESESRRTVLKAITAGGLLTFAGCERGPRGVPDAGPPGYPGKAADLIEHTDVPPNLETPLAYFKHDLTPNVAFFVRWHLAIVPLVVDRQAYRLRVDGHVDAPVSLSLDELRARFPPTEVVAVNQCSGNSRAQFEPRVPGVQWGRGAMGNARWRGARLRDVLAAVKPRAGAVNVSFHGLDRAPLPSVAEFEKSLPFERAEDADVLLAYEMNGEPLPVLNGFPLRLVVPGMYSTYWVKALDRVSIHPAVYEGYWMKKAYRIPTSESADESPDALSKDTRPIGAMNVGSRLVSPAPGERVVVNRPYEISGIAFDGGTGIAKVEVSVDGGATFRDARLDPSLGRYSFRRYRASWTPDAPGPKTLLVRATSSGGEVQRATPGWNRAGYMRNAIERTEVMVVA